jgi:predicted DNA-binding protein YlxM (UPF0122 family)
MAKVTSEMCKAIEAGIKSIAAIAEEAGVTKQAVVQMMKKYAGAPAAQAEPKTKKIKKNAPAAQAE